MTTQKHDGSIQSTTSKNQHSVPKQPVIEHFNILLSKSRTFCTATGLPQDLLMDIHRTDSDWAYILKIDALLETAAKELIKHGLKFKLMDQVIQNEILENFVDSLQMVGRTSLLELLDAAGLSSEDVGFIEGTRKVRNAYAHNIKCVEMKLIDLIKRRGDRLQLIRQLTPIKTYDEKSLIASYENDSDYLRFLLTMSAMRVLFAAYHLSFKAKGSKPAGPYRSRVVRE